MLFAHPAANSASAALVLVWFTACSDTSGEVAPAGSGTAMTSATAAATGGTTAGTSSASASSGATSTASSTGATATMGSASASASVTSTATAATTTGASTTGAGGEMSTASANGTTGSTSTGAGGSGGGASGAVVSDDFESVAAGGPPDAALWQLQLPAGGSNSIEVTTEQAHSGSQSVKVSGMSGSTMFFNDSVFPLPSGVVHFRVWMRFTNADWAGHNAFVASSPGQESQEVRFGGQNNAYHANLAADGDGLSPDPFEYPECPRCVAPVADEWKCLRGKFDFTGQAAELYVGDELAVDSAADGWHSGNGTFPQNPTRIGFGWALYGAQANTVYYDDLAIGYEPIPCN